MTGTAFAEVTDNADHDRFEWWRGGELVGILGYFENEDIESEEGVVPDWDRVTVSFLHTLVADEYCGLGFEPVLVAAALERARSYRWLVRPVCTHVRRYLAEHAEFGDVSTAA